MRLVWLVVDEVVGDFFGMVFSKPAPIVVGLVIPLFSQALLLESLGKLYMLLLEGMRSRHGCYTFYTTSFGHTFDSILYSFA